MKMTVRQKLGVAILVAVALAFIAYWLVTDSDSDPPNQTLNAPAPTQGREPTEVPEEITVVGFGGPVKVQFFENQEVLDILRNRYGIIVDVQGKPTRQLLCEVPLEGVDFLWAGDQSQLAIYEECRGRRDDYFNPMLLTPLVIYSWTDITDALIDAEVVELGVDGVYRADMLNLMALIESDKSWSDLGLPNRHSEVVVKTTDPNRSTSGQMFTGLLADTMNCLNIVNSSSVAAVLPGIHAYFEELGYMPDRSADLFRLYMSQGSGAYPLVALLESQIIETVVENPDLVEQLKNDIRIIYPEPTVWLTNPMISLTDGGRRFAEALRNDPDIQRLGWPRQGFRPTLPGVKIDLSVLPIPGVQERIDVVIDVPAGPILDQILEAVKTEYLPDPNAPPAPVCPPESTPSLSPVAERSD